MLKHKIKTALLLTIILSSSFLAQQPIEEWVRRFSDTSSVSWEGTSIKSDNSGNIYVLARSINNFGFIKYDSNGNLLTIASYWPGGFETGGGVFFDVTPSGDVYVTGGVENGFLGWIYTVKFNANGIFQWGRLYNRDNNDGMTDIKVDNAGDIIVIGGALVGNTGFGLILKYNSLGDTVWTKYFNNGPSAVFRKLALDNSNNLYIAGYIGIPSKCLIIKYSSVGTQNWFTSFTNDTTRSHSGQGITLDLNGNIYVVITASVPFSGLNNYLLKLTNNGTILWNRVFTGIISGQGRNSGSPKGPVISSDGNSIYFSTMSVNGLGGGSYSIATVKYNSAGDSQWVKVYNGGGVPGTANRISAIKLDRNNNIYICGSGYFQTTGDDFVTIKYTPEGIQQWAVVYTGIISNGGDVANDLLIDTSFNIYITGSSKKSTNIDNVAVTIKYSQPIGIISISNESPLNFMLYQNYPNPFNPATRIKFQIPESEHVNIIIYDIAGREIAMVVNEKLNPGIYEAVWDGSNLPSGVYFYRLTAGEYTQTNKMVLLK